MQLLRYLLFLISLFAVTLQAAQKTMLQATQEAEQVFLRKARDGGSHALPLDYLTHYILGLRGNIDVQDNEGKTALMLRAASSNYFIDPDTFIEYYLPGCTCALGILCAIKNSTRLYQDIDTAFLVHFGANPNIQDHRGWTALMYATQYDTRWRSGIPTSKAIDKIATLVRAGANPLIKNNEGKTFFDLLPDELKYNPKILQALKPSKKVFDLEDDTPYKRAFKAADNFLGGWWAHYGSSSPLSAESSEQYLDRLLSYGININSHDRHDNTVLMMVVHPGEEAGALERLRMLIKRGAQLDAQNTEGKTALLLTTVGLDSYSADAKKKMAMALLQAGANPYVTDKQGNNFFTSFQRFIDYDAPFKVPNALTKVLIEELGKHEAVDKYIREPDAQQPLPLEIDSDEIKIMQSLSDNEPEPDSLGIVYK